MSYDYNAILQNIQENRSKAYRNCCGSSCYPFNDSNGNPTAISNVDIGPLNVAVEEYATLSSHCPLPPILWLQYACDAGVLMEQLLLDKEDKEDMEDKDNHKSQIFETRLEILAAGMEEFPGCKLLRRWYLEELFRDFNMDGTNQEMMETKLLKSFTECIEWVCEGSYYYENEDHADDMLAIWKMLLSFLQSSSLAKNAQKAVKAENAENAKNELIKQYLIRRSKIPLKHMNDELRDEISALPSDIAKDVTFLDQIEHARKEACKSESYIAPFEDEITEAMEHEGIHISSTTHPNKTNHLWVYGGNVFLRSLSNNKNNDTQMIQPSYLMGLGGIRTANAFIKYASWYTQQTSTPNPQHPSNTTMTSMTSMTEEETQSNILKSLRIFERGISECPTVEHLWITYIHFLRRTIQNHPLLLSKSILFDACHRSIRNCPYSVKLYKLQMNCRTMDLTSEIDLDMLLEIAKSATDSKFLPTAETYLDVHMEVPRVVRRRLLTILSLYNEHFLNQTDKLEMIHDLIDDIREAYDAADLFVRKHYHNWNQGRGKLWRERASTEAQILYSIFIHFPHHETTSQHSSQDGTNRRKKSEKEKALEGTLEEEAIKCFEKLVRIQPKCVEGWNEYIAFITSIHTFTYTHNNKKCMFRNIMEKISHLRELYHRAVKTAGSTLPKPYEFNNVSLSTTTTSSSSSQTPPMFVSMGGMMLCQDFLSFEHNFGSLANIKNASHLIAQKWKKINPDDYLTPFQSNPLSCNEKEKDGPNMNLQNKRTLETIMEPKTECEDSNEQNPHKRIKLNHNSDNEHTQDISSIENKEKSIATIKSTNLKISKDIEHFVTIGNLKYPAHPYTIHVTNLSPKTQDMDLVNLFKQCGAIVHARIFREKHSPTGKAKSKGSGLIQFEERDSIDRALALSETVGLHDRCIQVKRSHCAAVGIVPPGMHKINPKGEGKRSHFNAKRNAMKQTKQEGSMIEETHDPKETNDNVNTKTNAVKESDKKKIHMGSLAFQPRGLTNRRSKQKKKVNLST